jgi:hypothetical protein
MASPLDFPARGKVLRVEGDLVVFNPSGTTYELHLTNKGGGTVAPSQYSVSAYVRCNARKVWTMPTGGNFVTPIFGPPKVLQGMVRYIEERLVVLQAGLPVIVTLPAEETAYDLVNGPVVPGGIINATLLPGGSFELANAPVGTA